MIPVLSGNRKTSGSQRFKLGAGPPPHRLDRALGIVAGVMLISPEKWTDGGGAVILAVVLVLQWLRRTIPGEQPVRARASS